MLRQNCIRLALGTGLAIATVAVLHAQVVTHPDMYCSPSYLPAPVHGSGACVPTGDPFNPCTSDPANPCNPPFEGWCHWVPGHCYAWEGATCRDGFTLPHGLTTTTSLMG